MESKLTDVSFRNEMVNITTSILKTIYLKEGQQFMIDFKNYKFKK